MQVNCVTVSRQVITSVLHRGMNLTSSTNGHMKMFSKLATSSARDSVTSNGSSTIKQMKCVSRIPGVSCRHPSFLGRSQLVQQIGTRWFCDKSNRVVEVDGKTSKHVDKVQQVSSNQQHEHFSARKASNLDRQLLVYFGKYKTKEEVPELVSVHLLNSTRNKFRIYVNLFIAGVTMMSCIAMIYIGHKRAGRGETLADQNMRRHPQHYKKREAMD